MKRHYHRVALLSLTVLWITMMGLSPVVAHAQPTANSTTPKTDVPVEVKPEFVYRPTIPFEFVMGTKFGGGATLWTKPSGTSFGSYESCPPNGGECDTNHFTIPMLAKLRGGYSYSFGFFAEAIVYESIGLEVGLHFAKHHLYEESTFGYFKYDEQGIRSEINADTSQEYQWTTINVPILLKGYLSAGNNRVYLGVGPEFAFTQWSQADMTVKKVKFRNTAEGDQTQLPEPYNVLQDIRPINQNSVYLSAVVGGEIVIGDFVMPIEVAFGYNLSQKQQYKERIAIDSDRFVSGQGLDASNYPTYFRVRTRDSMYGALRIGFAYRFK